MWSPDFQDVLRGLLHHPVDGGLLRLHGFHVQRCVLQVAQRVRQPVVRARRVSGDAGGSSSIIFFLSFLGIDFY